MYNKYETKEQYAIGKILGAMGGKDYHADANESIFFARELEYIQSQSYDVKFAQLGAFLHMPIDTSANPGSEVITYNQYEEVGEAKIIANNAHDLPRATVKGKQFSNIVVTIGNYYSYSQQDIRAARMASKNLDASKAMATVNAQRQLVNKLAFFGDGNYPQLSGLKTITTIPEVVIAADGTGSSKAFAAKTAVQIVRDINQLINAVMINSKGMNMATEVWLPINQYALINSTQNSTASDVTIKRFLEISNPGLTIKMLIELNGMGSGGTDRMYALQNSSMNWQLNIPMLNFQHAPQLQGLEYIVPMESRYGGLQVQYPLAFAFADGI